MSRKSGRRSSILKIDGDDDTNVFLGRNRRSSKRVSFASCNQVKEFLPNIYGEASPKQNDSPSRTKSGVETDNFITGLDKLLKGAVNTQYQDAAYYEDTTSENFNFFDVNETVVDAMDMDTTEVADNDIILAQMELEPQVSKESMIDTYSFLQKLRSKPSDRLKTLQIYSPNRENESVGNISKTSNLNFNMSSHDKENIPMDMDDTAPVANIDWKETVHSIYHHGKGDLPAHSDEYSQYNPETDIYTSKASNQNAGIKSFSQNVPMEETVPIGGILNSANQNLPGETSFCEASSFNSLSNHNMLAKKDILSSTMNQSVVMEETKAIGGVLSSSANQTVAMEETKAIGGIFSSTANQSVAMEETKAIGGILSSPTNQTVAMDETKAIGGILSSTANQTVAMEETKAIGGILSSSANKTVAMEETNAIGGILSSPTNQTVAMEETKAIGGILSSTANQTVAMEETKAVGGILSSSANQTVAMEETKANGGILSSPTNQTVAMDETKAIGGILSSTANQTVAMEETKAIGGILSSSANKTVAMEETNAIGGILSSPTNQTVAMEETKAIGGILGSPTNQTVAMEETKAIGGIFGLTANQTVAMEETKAIGGILGPTSNLTVAMEETKAGGIFSSSANQTVSMDETKAIGGILSSSANKTVAMEETKAIGGILSSTANQTVAMEETKAIGGILGPTTNQTVAMEETKAIGGFFSSPTNQTVAMVETNAIGGILSSPTNQTVAMEETKAIGGISCSPANRTVSMEETKPIGHILNSSATERLNETVNIFQDEVEVKNIEVKEINENDCMNKDEGACITANQSMTHQSPIDDDTEVAFRCLKRPLDKTDTGFIADFGSDKTQDFTQSETTRILKLKERLMQCTSSTSKHVHAGNIKTPSKYVSSVQKSGQESILRSPAHKRQCLFVDEDSCSSSSGKVDPTAGLMLDVDENGLMGIEMNLVDEEDTMTLKALAPDVNESILPETSMALDTTSTESWSCGKKSLANLSSNKSLNASSFVFPEGPISVATFFAMTKVNDVVEQRKGVRQSNLFFPKLDVEDLTQVLYTQLTTEPMLTARRQAKKEVQDFIASLKDEKAKLTENLEDSQPDIFQQVALASPQELKCLRKELTELMTTCNKIARVTWNRHTTQMYTQALTQLQERSIDKAREVMTEMEGDCQAVETLIKQLDQELENAQQDENRQTGEDENVTVLKRECENRRLEIDGLRKECMILRDQLEEDDDRYDRMHQQYIQTIKAHQLCSGWKLERLERDRVTFSYRDYSLLVDVTFNPQHHLHHVNITRSTNRKPLIPDTVALSFVRTALVENELKTRYPTRSHLKQLLQEVSECITEVEHLCKDMESAKYSHVFKFSDNILTVELWSRADVAFVTLFLEFNPIRPNLVPVKAKVQKKFGNVRECDIERELATVKPGPNYLTRLVQAVKFNTS